MAECNWDPNKHGGKPCPVHGSGKDEVTQKDGKFYREMDDGSVRVAPTKKELYEEPRTPEQLKEEFNDLLKEGLSEQEAVKTMLNEYEIPEDEVNELFGVEMPFDDDYDFENWGTQAVSVAEEELGINALDSYENYEQVCDWLMDNGYAEDFGEADKMIKDSLSAEGLKKFNEIHDEWMGLDDLEEDLDSDDDFDFRKAAKQIDSKSKMKGKK